VYVCGLTYTGAQERAFQPSGRSSIESSILLDIMLVIGR
jgi:hypothetical protein